MLYIQSAGQSHIGNVRASNQDVLLEKPELGLYAVLDGMGGANAGDVAAHMAAKGICHFVQQRRAHLPPRALLETALKTASAEVRSESMRNRACRGMGTTAVACFIQGSHAYIAHAGDSRAYLWRDHEMQPLTRDHTLVQELVTLKKITAEAALQHPWRNVLSRNLGGAQDVAVDSVQIDLRPGDRLLLCSDGLHGYARDTDMQALLGSAEPIAQIVEAMIALALPVGKDNITVLVIEATTKTVP